MATRILIALLAAALLAGCERSTGPDRSPLRLPALSVGEVHLPGRPAAEIQVEGGAQGGKYMLVALNTSTTAGSRLALEISGTGLTPPSEAMPAAQPALQAAATPEWLRERGRAWLERELRRRQQRELTPQMAAARQEVLRRAQLPLALLEASALAMGDTLTLNTAATCNLSNQKQRHAQVVAISAHAVVVVDSEVPAGGFTSQDFERFAQEYDAFVHPLITENFGAPADPFRTDGGRMVLFFTPEVNRMSTSGGFVSGFVWPGDLFPRAGEAGRFTPCAGSNEREMVYLMVPNPGPDPRFGQLHRVADVEPIILSTIAHEVQHVVNAGRRMYRQPLGDFEDVWLNEALSHLAEELLMFRTSGLEPRTRIDAAAIQASAANLEAFMRHQRPNFRRYRLHLAHPDSAFISPGAPLEARGAGWNFLRYVADHRLGHESSLWYSLVNTSRTGAANLEHALGATFMDRLLDWSVSVFADGAVPGLDPRWRQPSWDIRGVTAMQAVDGQRNYPLAVRELSATPTNASLGAGGNGYFHFAVQPGASARVNITSGGALPPADLSYAVVRVQ